mmetsp:Transcript_22987/g.48174  ORF Transcript_22987/g.48174 Transcript_22987/m.48174 type:complete len:470 (+) Transcript_22987:64-1473(+)
MESKPTESSSSRTMGIEVAEGEKNVVTRHVPVKGQRRNLGRQARKRRKKYLEIEAAASAFIATAAAAANTSDQNSIVVSTKLETTTNNYMEGQKGAGSNTTNSILPTDRSYVLNDVRRRTMLSESDRRELISQLGYLPGNALQVVARVEDAFSTEDLQRLFVATAGVTKITTKTNATTAMTSKESTSASNVSNSNVSKGANNRFGTIINVDEKSNEDKTNERMAGTMATMIRTMMKEPLVVKLYPLVLRDESSSTKRRRKRRRDENEASPELCGSNTNATGHENSKMTREDQSSLPTATTPKKTRPLMEPFPTIYWVTHPLIKALISKLELDKLNVRFEQRLLDDKGKTTGPEKTEEEVISRSSPLESMKRAHKSYGRERRELLSQRDMEYVKCRRWYEVSPPSNNHNENMIMSSTAPFSDGCGVAGIRNPKGVKCLHAHAAHYWSGNNNNVVGCWVEQELKKRKNSVQ